MKALQGQNLFDIAIQFSGSTESAFEFAKLNSLSVTDDLVSGQELVLPDIMNKDIASYYANKGINPATAYTEQITDISRIFFQELPIEFV